MSDFPAEALDKITSAIPSGRTVFHYTSQEGLLGIVKDKALWLSSIRHLSDATEFGYAVDLVKTKLTSKLQQTASRGPWHNYLTAVLGRLETMKDVPVFVGSFSEQADLLSQWRAYAPEGIGFSIGFEYEHLKNMAKQQGLSIMRCTYDQADHDAILENLIGLAGTLIKEDEFDKAVGMFFAGLIKFAPALKDPSFFEEKEWRVVSDIVNPVRSPLKFRTGRSMLIPYQGFKLAADGHKMPISRIIVGPTPHKDLSTTSLMYLLLNSPNVEPHSWTIAPSHVPYRSW